MWLMRGQAGPYHEIVGGGGGGVAKQFSTFSFQHGACRNKMSGIFKRCTAELAGWVTMRLPITPHAKSGGVRL